IANGGDGLVLTEVQGGQELYVPGRLPAERAMQLEEAIWEKMHFASHLRQQAVGEFTIGTELHRSDSLALVQLLILYHMLTARHLVSLGGADADFTANGQDDLLGGEEAAAG